MQGNLKHSAFSTNLARRIIIYGLMTLLLGSAQCAFFPILRVCPATPDLIMGMLLTITLWDSERSAAAVAVGAGFFIDAIGASGLALSPLIYLIYVLFISLFAKKVLKSFVSYLLLMIPTLLFRAAATYLCVFLAERSLPQLWVITEVLLPEALTTGLLCLPIYFIVKLCSGMLENHSRFTF